MDEMARMLEDVGVTGFADQLQKKGGGTGKPASPTKARSPQKSCIKEDFVDDNESDVGSDDSLADIGSSEDEETAQKRLNFKPPKLEPEGNEWRCAVCRVINDEGIPKCISCDTKNPDYKGGESKPAGGGIQFGFGGGASSAAAPKFGFGTTGASAAAPAAAAPALKFGLGAASPAPKASASGETVSPSVSSPAGSLSADVSFGFGGTPIRSLQMESPGKVRASICRASTALARPAPMVLLLLWSLHPCLCTPGIAGDRTDRARVRAARRSAERRHSSSAARCKCGGTTVALCHDSIALLHVRLWNRRVPCNQFAKGP